MKKLLLSLFALMTIGVNVWADGTVTVPNSRIAATRFTTLQVTLSSSSNAYRDLQFDLTLPEGITLKDATGGTVVDANHIVEYKAEGSTIHFVVVDAIVNVYDGTDATDYGIGNVPNSANYGKTLSDGIVIEIPVSAAASFTGEQTASLSNVKSSTDAGANVDLANANFTIKAVLLGDVNDSGDIDMSDAISIVYYDFGSTPANFVKEAGYVNTDENVDLSDAIAVVYMTFNSSSVKQQVSDVEEVEEIEPSEVDGMDPD